jgi:hypothetical protein
MTIIVEGEQERPYTKEEVARIGNSIQKPLSVGAVEKLQNAAAGFQ